MLYRIQHRVLYRYSRPVFIEPFVFRLRPRCDCTQRLLKWDLKLDPAPTGLTENVDLEGASTDYAWFDGLHESLTITAESEVETLRENPYGFILGDRSYATLPLELSPDSARALDPYRNRMQATREVDKFARNLLSECDGDTTSFLSLLVTRIHDDTERVHRLDGDPWMPERTLREKRGACRDVSVLFNDACRSLGLPARFVSGYFEGDPDNPENDLHAWSEVYLPGGGWRGFDPTHGLAVAARHVALIAGIEPDQAAPLTGSFRGTEANSEIEFDVKLRAVPN